MLTLVQIIVKLVKPAIDTTFVSVPLTIQVADRLLLRCQSDIDQMMETMYATAEVTKSAFRLKPGYDYFASI